MANRKEIETLAGKLAHVNSNGGWVFTAEVIWAAIKTAQENPEWTAQECFDAACHEWNV